MNVPDIDQSFRWPEKPLPGVGIIGCGGIVRSSHAPAYQKYGVPVLGVCDIVPENARRVADILGGTPRVFSSVAELLADPAISVIDIATHPHHRAPLVRQALAARKHVFVQKPFATTVDEAREFTALANQAGVRLAVNQNGRWAPPWRVAGDLVRSGAIGRVASVAHVFDVSFAWTIGTAFDDVPHWLIYDYAIHWIDISRCWLSLEGAMTVQARSWRLPWQPVESKTPWGLDLTVLQDGTPVIKILSPGARQGGEGHPFFIQGSEGTLRGSILSQADFVELDNFAARIRYPLKGRWFPDAFAGAMAEFLCAIAGNREPSHSARDNLLSLRLVLAACESASHGGQPVSIA